MSVVEMPGHEVVDVVPVWNRLVATKRTVVVVRRMTVTLVGWRAERRVRITLFDAVVVDMASVHVMQMTVLQEVAMPFVRDHCVHATFVVNVQVLRMIIVRHGPSLIRREYRLCSRSYPLLVHLLQKVRKQIARSTTFWQTVQDRVSRSLRLGPLSVRPQTRAVTYVP